MSNVRMPIVTTREGNKITKVCVEDVYKIINRVSDALEKSYNNSNDILDSIFKEYDGYQGELIIGTGVSEPCAQDKFNEKVGNDIAFMKCKLNANIKKHNFLRKIIYEWVKALCEIDKEFEKIEENIRRDLDGIRKYNPEYLKDIEFDLGIY